MSQADQISTAERADCALCADWLSTVWVWSQAALLAMLCIVIAAADGEFVSPIGIIALLVVSILERALAVRVALDARLFDRLARNELGGLPTLDAALQRVLDVPLQKLGRDLPGRIAGAKRLYWFHVSSSLLLIGLAGAAWWPQ